MKKWVKWGIIFLFLHVIIFTMPIYIYNIPGEYSALLYLPTLIIFIFEAPIFLINKILSVAVDYTNIKFVLLNCTLGALLYFFIGAFLAYVRSLPYKKR